VLVRMRPERWLTVDYAKQYQSRSIGLSNREDG
jgi:hypothetical protein